MKNKNYIYGKDLRYNEYSSKDGGYCVYVVKGEDPNCDWGGYHNNPFLGNVKGTFKEVLEFAANNMKGFYTWGSGGIVYPLKSDSVNSGKVINLDDNEEKRINRLKKIRKLSFSNLNYIIENIDIMSKSDIKKELINISKSIDLS